MTREEYLKDPCGASSLPLWKTNTVRIPQNVLIVRDDQFTGVPEGYSDERYFKLAHRMEGLRPLPVPDGFTLVTPSAQALSRHVASCYEEERISPEELMEREKSPYYREKLRIALADAEGNIAASGIAELDSEAGEGVLEWIQVSPGYRRRGLGRFIVNELLLRLKGEAEFATVSGKENSPDEPLRLYLACGFGEKVTWHVMTRNNSKRGEE